MLITVNGLVVHSYPSGNSDRIIHILTEDRGRLSVMVKGGAKQKGSAAAPLQLFTFGNYELYQGRGGDLYWYRGGSVLTSFFELSSDLTAVALATYLCDVAADMMPEETDEVHSGLLLRDLLNSLYVLFHGKKSTTLIKAVFELRAAALMGYRPDLTGCFLCGASNPEASYLDVMNGCLICSDCQTKRNRIREVGQTEEALHGRNILCPVSSSVLSALRYISEAPPKKIFSFSMKDAEEERALDRVTETFLLNQLEKDYDTLHFYRSVLV